MGKVTFDDRQLQAVETNQGQYLIISGAGSGKTRVLTHRVGRLIEKGARPGAMLVFTFTNDAANEMKTRLMAIVGDHVQALNVGTIHSQLNRMLRESIGLWKPFMNNYHIMDGWEQLRFVKDCFKELRMEMNKYQNPQAAIRKIGYIKNRAMTLHDYIDELESLGVEQWREEWFIRFYSYYERIREQKRQIGFDDMLSETYWMFRQKPEILEIYRSKFEYVMMDEFQDTNKVQLEVARMLQSKHENFFCVADPRQSIYAFRGAIPEYAVNFKQYFTGGRVVYLEYNYRCPRNIIELGNDLMDRAKWKFPRTKAHRQDDGAVKFYPSFVDGDEEAETLTNEIVELTEKLGYDYRDIVILYRTNAQSRSLEEQLIKRALPYKVEQSFYQSAEIRDMVAFLRYVHNDSDFESLKRIVNKPNRYLGAAFLDQLRGKMKGSSAIEALKSGTFTHKYMNTNAAAFASGIEEIRSLELDAVGGYMNVIRTTFGYDNWLREQYEEEQAAEKLERLLELTTLAHHFKTISEFLEYLAKLEDVSSGDSNAIELKTIHRSKGLEYKIVFVIGVSDGILPHARATDTEEERRLFYVAITRAIEKLYVSHVLTRFNNEVEPSGFLKEVGFDAGLADDIEKELEETGDTFTARFRKELNEIENDLMGI